MTAAMKRPDPFWLAWFAVLMLLVSARASAQVASVCGAGKRCSVRSLLATTSTANTDALVCVENSNGGGYGWVRSSQQLNLQRFTGPRCTSTATTWMAVDPFATLPSGSTVLLGGAVWATQGLNSAMSFASFSNCTAGIAGRLIFDSTNNVWRYCDGAGTWQQVASAASLPTGCRP